MTDLSRAEAPSPEDETPEGEPPEGEPTTAAVAEDLAAAMARPPTPDDVRAAYVWLLGRPVESEEAVASNLGHPSLAELRRVLMSSKEFSDAYVQSGASVAGRWVAVEAVEDRLLWLDLNDQVVSAGVMNRSWKPAETALVRSILKPGDVCIDGGANIGWFSVTAADCVGRFGRVLAYEPVDPIRARLERSVKANGWSAVVTVSDVALWDERGSGWLADSPEPGNPGHSWVSAEPGVYNRKSVEFRRLDDIADTSSLALIKLSVEGAEYKALRGAERTLRTLSPVVLAEFNPPMLRQVSDATGADLLDLMSGHGYACRLISPEGADDSEPGGARAVTAEELQALDEGRTYSLLFTR